MRLGDRQTIPLEDLGTVACELWNELSHGTVVWLTGDLGSGKTTFVQFLMDVADASRASSPTFSLVHEYESPDGGIFHVDCYRLKSADEALDIDFPDILRSARLLLIEWPERAGHFAPAADVHLDFSHADDPSVRQMERVL